MSRPPLRTYARHILRFGSRRAELGILLLSALNVALLLALFGILTSIASQLAFSDADGPRGFVPEAIASLPLGILMGLALAALLLSFGAALALRLFITAEAYRMFERATEAAFKAMRRESRLSDAHIREYPALLKNSVRFMSMAYLQGIALMFPVFLVVGIVAFGLAVQPVLTLAIAGAALSSVPVFLWQSRRGQLNSERLAQTLVTRSAHLNRYVTNLLRHPSREVADELDVRGYLDGEDGRAFRDSYVHRQRVGAFSTAVGTLGTVLGLAVVFVVLLFGPEEWFNLPGLVLAVLMFRVLESNFGSIMKLLGNLRATVPFTTAAVNLFERESDGFSGTEPPVVVDTAPDLPPPSALGAMVLCDLPWTREAATRIAQAIESARGTDRTVFALAGDFDLIRGRVGEELHPIDASPKLLYPFDTLARAADFLELPPAKRTQDAWEHLSPKGRFVLACLAERKRLEDPELVLALNASDVGLLTSDEREVLPWIFDRQGTVLVFESIPPATRLPDSLDLLSYDGRRLRRHGTVADYDGVVEGVYSELVLGLGKEGGKDGDGEEVDAELLALEDLDELVVDDAPADGGDREDDSVSPRLRVGYAPELETTVWYERWLMVRGRRVPPRRGGGRDGEDGGGNGGGGSPASPPDPHMSAFGLTAEGREAAAAAERAERERLETARLRERESSREEAVAARERLRTAEETARAAAADLGRTQARLAEAETRREAAEAARQDLEAQLRELEREQANSERRKARESGRAELREASRDEAFAETRAARDEALKARNALQRELDTERAARTRAEQAKDAGHAEAESLKAELARIRLDLSANQRELEAEHKARARAEKTQSRALEARDSKLASVREDLREARKVATALRRDLAAERAAREKIEAVHSKALKARDERVASAREDLRSARGELNALRRTAESGGRRGEAERASLLQRVASARENTKTRTGEHRAALREHKRETATVRRERDRLLARVADLEARLREWEG